MKFDSSTYIMDSLAIAKELEKRHPTPSLHLDSPLLPRAVQILGDYMKATRAIWMPKVPVNLLNPPSEEYFQRTRRETFGMPLAQYADEHGGEDCWKNAEGPIREMGELLEEHGGPFVMGKETSYADFVLASALYFMKRVDEAVYERITRQHEALGRLVDACAEWFEKGT